MSIRVLWGSVNGKTQLWSSRQSTLAYGTHICTLKKVFFKAILSEKLLVNFKNKHFEVEKKILEKCT